MKKTICNYGLAVAIVALIFAFAIQFWSFNNSFYAYEYRKSDVANEVGVSEDTLIESSDYLFNYLKGQHEDLDIVVEINGHKAPFYTHRDYLHMEDVKDLYQNFKFFSMIALVVAIALSIYLYLSKSSLSIFYNAYKKTLMVIGAVIGACLFMMVIDFRSFWFYFHFLLFDNDLWLISPSESNLIILMNQTLFNDLLFLITFSIIIMLSVLSLGLKYFIKRKEKLL